MEVQGPKIFSLTKPVGSVDVVAGGVGYKSDEWWPFAYYQIRNDRLSTINDIPVPLDRNFSQDVDAAMFAMDFAVSFLHKARIAGEPPDRS